MAPRVNEALTQVRRRFRNSRDKAAVEEYLSSEGFSRRQIGSIISAWLEEVRTSPQSTPIGGEPELLRPVRVLAGQEAQRFSREGWGYLVSLYDTGQLTPQDLEVVIERAVAQFDGQLTVDEVRAIVEGAGLATGGPLGGPFLIH